MRLNNRGDTIVEVLIAIAVVGVVLGGAYVSANRSLQGSGLAQERSQATKYAEEQLERLKVAASQSGTQVFTISSSFCLLSDITQPPVPLGVIPTDVSNDPFTNLPGGIYDTRCKLGSGGSFTYNTSVTRGAGNVFTVRVRWDGPRGNKQEAKLIYRVYP